MVQLLLRRGMTLLFAAAGAGIFLLLHLPLPFLLGPMAAALVAALCGAPLAGLGQVSIGARSVLGVAIGTSITPTLSMTEAPVFPRIDFSFWRAFP